MGIRLLVLCFKEKPFQIQKKTFRHFCFVFLMDSKFPSIISCCHFLAVIKESLVSLFFSSPQIRKKIKSDFSLIFLLHMGYSRHEDHSPSSPFLLFSQNLSNKRVDANFFFQTTVKKEKPVTIHFIQNTKFEKIDPILNPYYVVSMLFPTCQSFTTLPNFL